jgi:toxin FitB
VSYLLDTCVLSELTKPSPDSRVADWLAETPEESKFVSVVSLAEIKFGIMCAQVGQKRNRLEVWFGQVLRPSLADRVVPFDEAVALRWAALRIERRNAPILDSQIAASAIERSLTLVTRNVRDFAFVGLNVFNPWER